MGGGGSVYLLVRVSGSADSRVIVCFHKSVCSPAIAELPWNALWPFWSPGTPSMSCSSKLHVPLVLTAGSLQERAEQQNALNLLRAAPSYPQRIPSQTGPSQMLIEDSRDNFRRPFVFQMSPFGWLHYFWFFLNAIYIKGKGRIKTIDEWGYSVLFC